MEQRGDIVSFGGNGSGGRRGVARLLVPLIAAWLVGCAGAPTVSGSGTPEAAAGDTARPAANSLPIADLPIPPGARLEADSSLIMGSQDKWLGRLVLKADLSPTQAFNHFNQGMGGFGWSTITAVQGRVSTLSFLRGERVATILIEPAGLGGGVMLSITVSPRQAPAAPAGAAAGEPARR